MSRANWKKEPCLSVGFEGIPEYQHFRQSQMAALTILLLLGGAIMAELIADELQTNFKMKEWK
jgi:hypothetical protein